MSTPTPTIKLPLKPVECYGCQTCSFQRGHVIGYQDANGKAVSVFDLAPMIEQLVASVNDWTNAYHKLVGDLRIALNEGAGHHLYDGKTIDEMLGYVRRGQEYANQSSELFKRLAELEAREKNEQ